jgi:hypothetical protein
MRKPWFIFLVIAGLLSATYAAKITINTGSSLQYGSGVFQVKACDTWIGVGLTSTKTTGSGLSNVAGMVITGLNPTSCNHTNLRLSLYTSGSSTPLPIFTGQGASGTVSSSYVVLRIDSSLLQSGDNNAGDAVTLVNPAGQVLTSGGDSYEYIDSGAVANGNWDGTLNVTFNFPLCQVSSVNSVVLESASA